MAGATNEANQLNMSQSKTSKHECAKKKTLARGCCLLGQEERPCGSTRTCSRRIGTGQLSKRNAGVDKSMQNAGKTHALRHDQKDKDRFGRTSSDPLRVSQW